MTPRCLQLAIAAASHAGSKYVVYAEISIPKAVSFGDLRGVDFAFYLGMYTHQSDAGVELRGPQRWRVRANWKIACENFAGDMYHTPQTHTSVVESGLFREPKAAKRKDGATYWAANGGGTTYTTPPGPPAERPRPRPGAATGGRRPVPATTAVSTRPTAPGE